MERRCSGFVLRGKAYSVRSDLIRIEDGGQRMAVEREVTGDEKDFWRNYWRVVVRERPPMAM